MRARLLTAFLACALIANVGNAQMRGGLGGHRGGGIRVGVAPRGPVVQHAPGVAFRGGRPFPVQRGLVGTHGGFGFSHFNHPAFCNGFGRCFNPPFFPHGFHHHRNRFFFGFGTGPFFTTWGSAWPYYGYGLPIYNGDYANYPAQNDADVAERERLLNDLQEERRRTDELRDEMAQFRAAAPAPSAQPPVAANPEKPAVPTMLVFRDKRRLQVPGYAVEGNFLYVIDEHRMRKIALSDLDVPATVAENEKNGVQFQLPSKPTK